MLLYLCWLSAEVVSKSMICKKGKLTSDHVKVSKVLTPDLESNQCYGSLSFGLIIKVKVNLGESESKVSKVLTRRSNQCTMG